VSDPQRTPDSGAHRRAGRPTPAQRREQRAQVESAGEVLDAAARYLEARPRSEAEVRGRLVRLGYRRELVDEAVGRLVELRYLDDEAFARAWVDGRDRSRPRGEHALRMELGRKGVDRAVAEGILDERREDALLRAAATDDMAPLSADEDAAERLLARKLAPIQREPDARKRRQKAYALLARNGFSPDVCAKVSRRVADAAIDPADEDAAFHHP
jgi:regulatory protein